ncbi:MAG: LPS-assembly protein LptD [wastewater metagenome]|nr:LPS-assembly protein LptD [Candidatus Loosdrechtia aerotolerans]
MRFFMQIVRIFFILFLVIIGYTYSYAEGLLSVKHIEKNPFSLSAKHIQTWKKEGIRVFVAEGNAAVLQVPFQITADTIICWFHEDEAIQSEEAIVEVYSEGNVTILRDENYEKYEQVYLKFITTTGIVVDAEKQPIKTFEEPQKTDAILRGEEIRSKKKEEYFSTKMPERAPVPGVPPEEEMVDIVADTIDSWVEDDKRVVVALGNVMISKEDITIDADNVILWFGREEMEDSKSLRMPLTEVYAEGNVTMRREDDIFIADKIFENIREDKGIFVNSQIKAIPSKMMKPEEGKSSLMEEMPVYINSEEIRHVTRGEYEMKNGTLTTCGFGHPHYHFHGNKIRLIRRDDHTVITSRENTFNINDKPLFYIPYLSFNVRERKRILRDWQFGSSSRFGPFLRTDWDVFALTGGAQGDWSDLIFSADYLQKRGVGTGLDYEYRREDMYGYVSSYYINDSGEFDINDIPVEQESRGTMLWRHRQELPYDIRMDAEFSYLSDSGFLREYFPQEFREGKDRETVLYFRRIHDTVAETFLVSEQVNDFDTLVDSLRERRFAERHPEVAYRILGEPVWDNRLIFTSESSVTNFGDTIEEPTLFANFENTIFDDIFDRTDDSPEPQSLVRADSVNRITMPFKPGFFNINPFVEGRITGYSESIDTSGSLDEPNGPATGRFIGSFGLDWSSTHWRTYSVYSDFFNINRLRHIFVPELRYRYSPVVTEDPNELFRHDRIDELDSSQVVVVGVKNKVQTKRGKPGYERTSDFLELNVDYYMFPTDEGIFTDGINGIIIREDDFINIDFRARLTDIITFVSERNEFNTEEFQFDVLTAGLEFYKPPDWEYFIGHRFIRDVSSTIILGANYHISEKWSVMFVEKYDLESLETEADGDEEQEPQNLKTSFVLSRYFHDWVASIVLELDPVRDDNSFRFDISPKGMQRIVRRFWF